MNNKFNKGEVWTYKTRKGEEKSVLTILEIQPPNVIHVMVDKLQIKNHQTGKLIAESIEHMPFSIEALNNSVLQLVETVKTDGAEGYLIWKESFDKGEAGFWSLDVAASIAAIEESF